VTELWRSSKQRNTQCDRCTAQLKASSQGGESALNHSLIRKSYELARRNFKRLHSPLSIVQLVAGPALSE
jgi:hypothetical protein